jgi:hypothetical protein
VGQVSRAQIEIGILVPFREDTSTEIEEFVFCVALSASFWCSRQHSILQQRRIQQTKKNNVNVAFVSVSLPQYLYFLRKIIMPLNQLNLFYRYRYRYEFCEKGIKGVTFAQWPKIGMIMTDTTTCSRAFYWSDVRTLPGTPLIF